MDIYMIECDVTKQKYIGQCKRKLSNGKLWGYQERYKQHIRSIKNGRSNCRKLKHSFLKYGESNHKIRLMLICDIEEADNQEKLLIRLYNTLHPNGLNIESGGNEHKTLSENTKKLMSEARKGHRNYLKEDSPEKISKGLVKYWDKNPKIKLDHNGNNLPKYIKCVKKDSDIIGYAAFIHHNNKTKKVTSKKLSLDEKLSIIKDFVEKEK